MCGIAGFIGSKEAAPIVVGALTKLEYRGYDSAGLATVSGGRIWAKKDTGKLPEVCDKHQLNKLPGLCGIGHVRWATHGGVTSADAHPHLDCRERIAVVHNGIIENYKELKLRLGLKHTFTSNTDTEVIAHMIEEYIALGYSLEDAVLKVTRELKGSYALAVISATEPDKLVATRKDSPLVVGIGKGGNFIASDTLSFLDETKLVIFIEDGETVVITGNKIYLIDDKGRKYTRHPQKVDWDWGVADKGDHDFFMLKEIMEQPDVLRRAMMQDRGRIVEIATEILRAKNVVFTACGTSRYATLIGRYLFSRVAGKFSDVVIASEFGYFSDSIDPDTLVIAVSQSGETADVMDGVKKAKAKGARILSVVNMVGSSLARTSDWTIYLNCGPEIGVAATKSFVTQLAVFYLLSFAMANRLDEVIGEITNISRLIEDGVRHNHKEIPGIAGRFRDRDKFYYIARGINYSIAGEGALKLKEIAYVHTEGIPAGELKHGTLALVDKETPVVAICPNDYTFSEMLCNISEVKARGAYVIGISDRDDDLFDAWIKIPEVKEIFYPLVSVIPLQLLAYHSALAREFDPDKPRNLAKSVTVK
ncbi:glutamine--fructose-6-phosphate transaminase (isomerizing) [Chloroflexota bacterium]